MNRILLVNDHDDVRNRTAHMLDVLGWEVFVAETDQLVFESLVACRPSIVVVDVEMEGGAGFESIATARRLFPDLCIIAVSRGAHEDAWPKIARFCGANSYLSGPVSATMLSDMIDAALRQGFIDDKPDAVCGKLS
jgi:DNA-binding response OmpR family regulator